MSDLPLIVDKDAQSVSWSAGQGDVSITCQHIHQALAFPEAALVLVLTGPEDVPSHLAGYSIAGDLLFEAPPPTGFSFSYLTQHPTAGVAVVCGGAEKTDGWYDWHFAINAETGSLTKHCPAF